MGRAESSILVGGSQSDKGGGCRLNSPEHSLSGESIPQAPRFSPPGILDLMLFLAGVGITLPFSSATAWKASYEAGLSGGIEMTATMRVQIVLDSALGVVQGLACGALFCVARRRLSGEKHLPTQPGHLLLLLPIPYFLLTGPLAHSYWLAKSWNIDLIEWRVMNWVYPILEILALVGLALLALWMRRLPCPALYQWGLALFGLSRVHGLLQSLPGIGRVWLRRALSRPWFFGLWLWLVTELLQLLFTLTALAVDLRCRTPRDWLHYVGGALWALHCALNLGQASCSLISLYWR
jgi:hypothetical protein